MPLWIIPVAIRVVRALSATLRLLSDATLLRSLPWSYICRLPLRNAWIAVATTSVIGTLGASIALPLTSETHARHVVFYGGLGMLGVGLASSGIRSLLQHEKLRS
jgi:hypothetical protein